MRARRKVESYLENPKIMIGLIEGSISVQVGLPERQLNLVHVLGRFKKLYGVEMTLNSDGSPNRDDPLAGEFIEFLLAEAGVETDFIGDGDNGHVVVREMPR